MLEIDRLKKLKLAAKRSAQQNAEIFQASLQPSQQSSNVSDSHWSPSVIDLQLSFTAANSDKFPIKIITYGPAKNI